MSGRALNLRRFMNPSPEHALVPEDAAETVFLADCDADEWNRIVAHCEWRRFGAGDDVAREGEVDRALLIVVAGTVELLVGGRVVNVIEAPSLVGEVTFFDEGPRSGTLRARSDGELLRLPFPAFEALAAEAPVLARTILLDTGRIVARRLRRLTTLVAG
ncbi:MAG TPA: cyclic nucleotide-binding domain-containing protein [Gaiellaceae bacterium]